MALTTTIETRFGLELPLYYRLNNFDQLPNRQVDGGYSVPAIARFRGFASQELFQLGFHFIDELTVEFVPTFEGDIRAEAYAALKAHDPTVAIKQQIAEIDGRIESTKASRKDEEGRVGQLDVALAAKPAKHIKVQIEADKKAIEDRIAQIDRGLDELTGESFRLEADHAKAEIRREAFSKAKKA
jgi:hypothetical protein